MGGVLSLPPPATKCAWTRASGSSVEYTAASSIRPLKYGLLEPQVLSPPTFHQPV